MCRYVRPIPSSVAIAKAIRRRTRPYNAGMAPRIVVLIAVTLVLGSCSAPASDPAPPTLPVMGTPTTIVMVVTVPPISTVAKPTQVPAPAMPTATPGPESAIKLTSDGISTPPGFRLAGGDYMFAWDVPRPTSEAGCFFGAMLTSEPSVSPFTLQTLGPWTVAATAGYSGSKRIDGLGAGGYTLRPNGDCPWTVTITPIRGR